MSKYLVWLGFIISLLGCIQVQTRSSHEMTTAEGATQRARSQRQETDSEIELKLLENRLKGNQEIEQYSKALPYFRDLSERILFLRLESFKARQKWLIQNDFWSRVSQLDAKFAAIIKAQDIAVGMTSEQLKKSWGEPNQVFVSGIPQFGNGRWVYIKQAPTPDGFKIQKRIVYLESGLVTGWDTQ
jgi:hypothetical protein